MQGPVVQKVINLRLSENFVDEITKTKTKTFDFFVVISHK